MRKILFMLMLVVLSLPTFAQNLQWIDTVGTAEKTIRIGDFSNNTLRGSWYYGRLPVTSNPASVLGTTTTTYGATLNALSTDQTTTLAITSNYIDIVNYSSAMAWVCVDGTYSTNAIPIPPYGTYRWAVATATLHYKLDSGTGVIYIIAQ